jgi:hypothetical protein
MFVISKSKSGKDVSNALEFLISEINTELEKVDGLISSMECEVSVGPLDASVTISVFVDGDVPRHKFLVGVNEKGYNKENSMKKAEKRVNSVLNDKGGDISGSYVKTISHLPGRVYTTLIVSVNEDKIEEVTGVDSRRNRIKKGLILLGNDPSVINVAKLAKTFNVSRTMVYKDLEALGYKRR